MGRRREKETEGWEAERGRGRERGRHRETDRQTKHSLKTRSQTDIRLLINNWILDNSGSIPWQDLPPAPTCCCYSKVTEPESVRMCFYLESVTHPVTSQQSIAMASCLHEAGTAVALPCLVTLAHLPPHAGLTSPVRSLYGYLPSADNGASPKKSRP